MLTIKSITSCNINGKPLYSSNLTKRIIEYKTYINSNYNKDYKINDNELVIVSMQGLYGYRCGIIGYLVNSLNYTLCQYYNPCSFQNFLNNFTETNILSNDLEIITFWISFLSGKIPILNIGNWDIKKSFFKDHPILKCYTNNLSLPSIFDLKSIYLLKPMFDCGCSIYSNKKPIENGFQKWNNWDRGYFKNTVFNNGLIWSIYESETKQNGIAIINVHMTEDAPDWIGFVQISQLIKLKEDLEIKFNTTKNYIKYETFITGNFQLNLEKINFLESKNIHLYNQDFTTKNLIFHNEYIKADNDILKIKHKTIFNLSDGDSIFNVEFYEGESEKEEISVVNPLSKFVIVVDDCLEEKPISPKKEEIPEKPVLEEIVIDKYVLNDDHFKKNDGSNSNTSKLSHSNSESNNSDSDWVI